MSEKIRRLFRQCHVPGNLLAPLRPVAAQGGQPKPALPAKPRKPKNKARNSARSARTSSPAAVERARVAAILRSDQAKGREHPSEEIEAAIPEAERAAEAAKARVPQLRAERGEALLAGDDREVDRIEAEIRSAEREAERAVATQVALVEKFEAAQEREEFAKAKAIRARALKAQQIGIKHIKLYAKCAAQIQQLLRDLVAIDEVIGEANREMTGSGLEAVDTPNTVMRYQKPRRTPAERQVSYRTPGGVYNMGAKGELLTRSGRPAKYERVEVTNPERVEPGHLNRPLPEEVILPDPGAGRVNLWGRSDRLAALGLAK